MAKFTDYTQKTKPADADLLLIHDNAGAANKKTPFSGVWSWILDKLASAVISQLETTNKSIIPAINELNSKSIKNNLTIENLNDLFSLNPGVYIHRFVSYNVENVPNGYSGFVITHVHGDNDGSQWIYNLQGENFHRIKSTSGIGEWASN